MPLCRVTLCYALFDKGFSVRELFNNDLWRSSVLPSAMVGLVVWESELGRERFEKLVRRIFLAFFCFLASKKIVPGWKTFPMKAMKTCANCIATLEIFSEPLSSHAAIFWNETATRAQTPQFVRLDVRYNLEAINHCHPSSTHGAKLRKRDLKRVDPPTEKSLEMKGWVDATSCGVTIKILPYVPDWQLDVHGGYRACLDSRPCFFCFFC